ncbi:aspartyl-phosphate phosphatase Spo0E family protein [Paenibacillus sp. GCM10027626]|uniref:aspartyl-phosphate phosphatase Spo0E family protein n=1 Tax=Paenibacillus sp. GCM10027626 TaxID=3273411 RepID=UPI003638B8E5
MKGVHKLREKIEETRAELNERARLFGIRDKEVLEKSQELDRLLNAYHRALNDEGNHWAQ